MDAACADSRFAVAADPAGAGEASAWLARECEAHGVPAAQLYRLDTCLTEALANIIAHGGAGARAAPVTLWLRTASPDSECRAELVISDHGRPFDPLAHAAAPPARTLAEATPGGLGLTMIRNFSDSREYAYQDAQNRLTLRFAWPLSP